MKDRNQKILPFDPLYLEYPDFFIKKWEDVTYILKPEKISNLFGDDELQKKYISMYAKASTYKYFMLIKYFPHLIKDTKNSFIRFFQQNYVFPRFYFNLIKNKDNEIFDEKLTEHKHFDLICSYFQNMKHMFTFNSNYVKFSTKEYVSDTNSEFDHHKIILFENQKEENKQKFISMVIDCSRVYASHPILKHTFTMNIETSDGTLKEKVITFYLTMFIPFEFIEEISSTNDEDKKNNVRFQQFKIALFYFSENNKQEFCKYYKGLSEINYEPDFKNTWPTSPMENPKENQMMKYIWIDDKSEDKTINLRDILKKTLV